MNKRYKRENQKLRHQRYKNRKVIKYRSNRRQLYYINQTEMRSQIDSFLSYSSPTLQILDSSKFALKHKYKDSVVNLNVPKVFCLSKNPDESLYFLRLIYSLMTDFRIKSIHFNHFTCEYMGVCASTIMDIIILECIKLRRSKGINIDLSGDVKNNKVSNNKEVDALVKMSGLLHHLSIYKGKVSNTEKLELFVNGSSAQVAEQSIEYINRSLSRHNVILTKEGVNHFGKFFGEIIDNCKLHGGEKAIWYTIGHYDYDTEINLGKCKLCILDFGDTIYESLKRLDKRNLKNIDKYVKRSWFSIHSRRNEETLYTLFSLQQRVSRIYDPNVIRGNGTITYIESFLKLFNTQKPDQKSIFSITSGKCSILFDGKYKLKDKSFNEGQSNKIIAFNDDNDLEQEPDSSYVRTLKNGFPGTVISMDLYIDNKFLKGVNSNG